MSPPPEKSPTVSGCHCSLSETNSCFLSSYQIIVSTRLGQGHRTIEKYSCGLHLYVFLTVYPSVINSDKDSSGDGLLAAVFYIFRNGSVPRLNLPNLANEDEVRLLSLKPWEILPSSSLIKA